ncbi:MAG: hypothetical protein AAF539_10375 [Planctomycetota bacterium]
MTSPNPASSDSVKVSKPGDKSTDQAAFRVPRMGAEAGFEVVADEAIAPLRWSGFLSLLLGLLSVLCIVAYVMVAIPIAAILVGMMTLRKHEGLVPIGTRPAMLGILLATGFGACGIVAHESKRAIMGGQATTFARNFLDVVESGDVPLALELQKTSWNRQMVETDIDSVYSPDENNQELLASATALVSGIQNVANVADWQLAKSPRVYQKFGSERVDTIWEDVTGTYDKPLMIQLEWHEMTKDTESQWHVSLFQRHREKRLVAPITQ